ncbi:MAG: thiamine pyrophosphate-binding protein [Chloroflexota bacterium]
MAQQPAERAYQGGKHIGAVLREEGVEYYFGVTGRAITPVYIGIGWAGLKLIHMRHEQAAGFAGNAYARCSRRLGVALANAGPGLVNTVAPVAMAYWGKVPMVFIYSQHTMAEDGRGPSQESYADKMLASTTKWVRRVVHPNSIAYLVKKACRDAMTYPQGPVALEFPFDVTLQKTKMSEQAGYVPNAYQEPAAPAADPKSVEAAVKKLLSAERPAIAGGESIFWSNAEPELQEFVELTNIPVITRRVSRGAVPEDHPLAFSGRCRGAILRSADVACIIGLQLGLLEGYGAWAKNLKLIQVAESKADIETTAPTDTIIIGNAKSALRQMIDCAKDMVKKYPKKEAWLKKVDEIKAEDKARMNEDVEPNRNAVPIHPAVLSQEVCEYLDKDATIILDSLTQSHYFTERFIAHQSGSLIDTGLFMSVGHGVGMGIGAQLARPGKQVVVSMGDGGMGVGGFDVETAVRSNLPVCYLLANNGAWMAAGGGVFRKVIPTVGTQYYSPWSIAPTNYAKVFEAMGAYTERVEKAEDIKPALERAFKSGKTSVLDVVTNPSVPLTAGSGKPPSEEQRVRGNLMWMDPEDFPDDLRKKYIDTMPPAAPKK